MDSLMTMNYHHPDKTAADIQSVRNVYKSLVPKREPFVFLDGRRMELIKLSGTIPVCIKKTTYNTPICIWLMDTHPVNPPICYVTPTSTMRINTSRHVDYNGKIFAPYLHEWNPNKSNLLTLIQTFITLFSEQPPLYSVPADKPPEFPYPKQQPYYSPLPSTSTRCPYPSLPYPVTEPSVLPQCPTNLPYPTTSPSLPNDGTIDPVHIRASLLSAAEDKMRRMIRERTSQWKYELDSLQRIQNELMQGKDRLTHILSKLESEQSEWEKVLTTLRDKDSELDLALISLSNQGEMDVDEAVVTTAPLYKQLLNAYAEEAATEDAIYYLGEGLRRGVIDLDVFLKHVRSLSRKQFMLRALMHRCRNRAGLAN